MENLFTDEYFMKKALQEAQLAFEKNEIPVGAVVVIDNRIVFCRSNEKFGLFANDFVGFDFNVDHILIDIQCADLCGVIKGLVVP